MALNAATQDLARVGELRKCSRTRGWPLGSGSTEAIPSSLQRVVKRPKNLPSGFDFFGGSNTRDRVQAKSYAKLLLS